MAVCKNNRPKPLLNSHLKVLSTTLMGNHAEMSNSFSHEHLFSPLQHCLHVSGCAAVLCCLWLCRFSLWNNLKCLWRVGPVLTENRNLFDTSEGSSFSLSSKAETQQGLSAIPGWLTVRKGKKWKWEGGKRRRDRQDDQWWQKHKLCGTGWEREGEREKREAGNDAKSDWTQTEIGGSGRWSEIAGVEIRGSKRQMRHIDTRWEKRVGKIVTGTDGVKKRLEGERFEDNVWQRERWMPEIRGA